MQTNPRIRNACVCVEFGHAHESRKNVEYKQDRGKEDSVWSCSSGTPDPRPVLLFFLLPFIGTAWLGRRKDTLWASGRVLGPKNLFRDGLSLSKIVLDVFRVFVLLEAWMEPGWKTGSALYLQEETREIAEERPVVDVDFVELEAWQLAERGKIQLQVESGMSFIEAFQNHGPQYLKNRSWLACCPSVFPCLIMPLLHLAALYLYHLSSSTVSTPRFLSRDIASIYCRCFKHGVGNVRTLYIIIVLHCICVYTLYTAIWIVIQ